MISNAQVDSSRAQPSSRLLWLMAGVLGASSLAAGATWLARSTGGSSASVPAASVPMAAAATTTRPMNPTQEAAVSGTTGAPRSGSNKAAATGSDTNSAPAPSTPTVTTRSASVCTDCGVVESVRAYTVKGEGSGVGAVAGGVLGAAVGSQMGKGEGRKAMTVLGALGGGLAGHEVEKRTNAETLHDVTVRMNDGSFRTVSQSVALRIGARVRLEGKSLKEIG
jgi:outer membrane lipoprotein SlyB